MKTNKVKSSLKAEKKMAKQTVKKDLEASITNKFLEALKSLGHDADKFSKDIKKTSKELAKKLSKKYNDVKVAVEEKLDSKSKAIKIKTIKRPITTTRKTTGITVKKAAPLKVKAVKKSSPSLVMPAVAKKPVTAVKKTTKAPVSAKVLAAKPATVKKTPAAAKKVSIAKPVTKKVKVKVTPVLAESTKPEDNPSK